VGFLWSLLSLGVDVAAGLSLSLSLIELGARTASLDAQRYRLNSAAFPRDAIDGGRAGRRDRDHLMTTAMPFACVLNSHIMPICTKAHVMPNRQLLFGTQDSPAVGRNSKSSPCKCNNDTSRSLGTAHVSVPGRPAPCMQKQLRSSSTYRRTCTVHCYLSMRACGQILFMRASTQPLSGRVEQGASTWRTDRPIERTRGVSNRLTAATTNHKWGATRSRQSASTTC
jgi:hypothetical protein